MRVQAVSMSTHQPPDLAAIRTLCGKLADGPQHGTDYALAAFEAAKALPVLLSLLDEVRLGVSSHLSQALRWTDSGLECAGFIDDAMELVESLLG